MQEREVLQIWERLTGSSVAARHREAFFTHPSTPRLAGHTERVLVEAGKAVLDSRGGVLRLDQWLVEAGVVQRRVLVERAGADSRRTAEEEARAAEIVAAFRLQRGGKANDRRQRAFERADRRVAPAQRQAGTAGPGVRSTPADSELHRRISGEQGRPEPYL